MTRDECIRLRAERYSENFSEQAARQASDGQGRKNAERPTSNAQCPSERGSSTSFFKATASQERQ